MDEDWHGNLTQITSFCDEYVTDNKTRIRHFGHSLLHKPQAYHYYKTLWKSPLTACASICSKFEEPYHSETKIQTPIKTHSFRQFSMDETKDDADFKKTTHWVLFKRNVTWHINGTYFFFCAWKCPDWLHALRYFMERSRGEPWALQNKGLSLSWLVLSKEFLIRFINDNPTKKRTILMTPLYMELMLIVWPMTMKKMKLTVRNIPRGNLARQKTVKRVWISGCAKKHNETAWR